MWPAVSGGWHKLSWLPFLWDFALTPCGSWRALTRCTECRTETLAWQSESSYEVFPSCSRRCPLLISLWLNQHCQSRKEWFPKGATEHLLKDFERTYAFGTMDWARRRPSRGCYPCKLCLPALHPGDWPSELGEGAMDTERQGVADCSQVAC